MADDTAHGFQPTRQYLVSEGQVRAAFVLSFVGMVGLLLLLLVLATARPQGRFQALDGARPAPALKNTLRGKRALPSQNTSGPASDATPEAQAEDRHRRELDPSPYGHLALPAGAPERR